MPKTRTVATVLTFALGATSASAVVINSNNGGSGDNYTNTGARQGQLVGATDFVYNNVGDDGVVGINTNYARSGNGSAFFSTASGSSKADLELLRDPFLFSGNYFATGVVGTLGDLTSLSYDWYRDSASTNPANQHVALRILVDADGDLNTTDDRGGLVFERVYNSAAILTDQWVTDDIMAYNGGNGANLWSFGAGMTFAQEGFGNSFADWASGTGTIDANSAIIGFSAGVGSGWNGAYLGAIDNLTIGINGDDITFNFEVIPTPGAAPLAAIAGLVAIRRRRH
ncbi:MAG: hypothetical protein AAGB34_04630 [Planctomycetota bacterium]